MTSYKTVEEALRELLIKAGTQGLKQYQITSQLQRYGSAKVLRDMLEDWELKQWVQRFEMPRKNWRPTTVWRATTLILNSGDAEALRSQTTAA